MPLGIFRLRNLTGANIVGLLLGAAIFSMFFFLSLYMQQVLGYSALRTGFAYLLVAVVIIIAAGVVAGPRHALRREAILAIGMTLLTAWAALVHADRASTGTYIDRPGARLHPVRRRPRASPSCRCRSPPSRACRPHEAGIASGLINTSQQIGGALGIAILSTIATTHTESLMSDAGGDAVGSCRAPSPRASSTPSRSAPGWP